MSLPIADTYSFARNKTIVKSIDDQWKADLCDIQSTRKQNNVKAFILRCIDCFSKHAWAESPQQKTAAEIIKASEKILDSGRKLKRIQPDCGSDFTNKKVQAFLRKHNMLFSITD